MTKEERREYMRVYNRDYYQKHKQSICLDKSEKYKKRKRYSVPRQVNSHGYYRQQSIEAAYEQRINDNRTRIANS